VAARNKRVFRVRVAVTAVLLFGEFEMRKCFVAVAAILMASIAHAGGTVKEVLAIKVFVAGQVNTKNAKIVVSAKTWADTTLTEIDKTYKERDAKESSMTADQKKVVASLSTIINAKYEKIGKQYFFIKGKNTDSITAVGEASQAILDNDLATAIIKHKAAVGLQGEFAKTWGLLDMEGVRLEAYLDDLKSILKEIPYPMNMGDM
jgi:hypothetical protein